MARLVRSSYLTSDDIVSYLLFLPLFLQNAWEGYFYFQLSDDGLILAHIFDRKVQVGRPSAVLEVAGFPWMKSSPKWTAPWSDHKWRH